MIINKLNNKENKIINIILEIKPKILHKKRDYLFLTWNAKDFVKKINSDNLFTQGDQAFLDRGKLEELNCKLNRLTQLKLARVKGGKGVDCRQNLKIQKNKYSILDLKCKKQFILLKDSYRRNHLCKFFNKKSYVHK